MARLGYQPYEVIGTGGINQQIDKANPKKELEDARNIWAPSGRLEARPGFWGVGAMEDEDTFGSFGGVLIVESPLGSFGTAVTGVGTLTMEDMPIGHRWYYGLTVNLAAGETGGNSISVDVSTANSSNTTFKAEYYNGSYWQHLNVTESMFSATVTNGFHLSDANSSRFFFAPPKDWSLVTITDDQPVAYSRYWIRFTIKEAIMAGSVAITIGQPGSTNGDDRFRFPGSYALQFSAQKKYLHLYNEITTDQFVNFTLSDSIDPHFGKVKISTGNLNRSVEGAPSMAIVPEFDEAFISHGMAIFKVYPEMPTNTVELPATVENRNFAVGDGSPYDPNYIAQLNSFPEAKYISYFNNRLWAANLRDDPFGIRWSGPAPFHKVWPSLSREVLMEDDNSPITAIHPLGEQMVVFKQDSIWVMVDTGIDPFALQEFVPKRVVAGVGCTASNSIQKIKGHLVFLAEDGIYVFDGTPNIVKISDNVNESLKKINRGRRYAAASANWRINSLYLLSASTTGTQANDLTFAWDYKNNSWWLWDTIDAQSWITDEDQDDEEILCFVNQFGHILQMDLAKTDNGAAISTYYVTQRQGRGDKNRKVLRYIELESTNKSGSSVTIEPLVNDERTGTSGITGTADFTDSNDIGYERRRRARIGFRREFDWIQAKVSHSVKNAKFKAGPLDMAYYRKGVR